ADDAQFLEIATSIDDDHYQTRRALGKLAAEQKREDIIRAYPEIALGSRKWPNESRTLNIVDEAFVMLDPKDSRALKAISDAAPFAGHSEVKAKVEQAVLE